MNMLEDSTHCRPPLRLISPVGVREPREHPVLENWVREAPLLELDLRLEPFELALRLFSCFRDTWRGAERRIERLLDLDLGLGTMSMRTGIARGPSLEILVSLRRQQQMIMTIIITKASTDTYDHDQCGSIQTAGLLRRRFLGNRHVWDSGCPNLSCWIHTNIRRLWLWSRLVPPPT